MAANKYPALQRFLEHTDASYHEDFEADGMHDALLSWYTQNRRRLPWRGDAPPYNGSTAGSNKKPSPSAEAAVAAAAAAAAAAPPATAAPTHEVSPYGVWVSEIMCQQTRVEAVIPYWLAWMEAFPTVQALASASEESVNAKWAGLGFYRRARMLHEGAKQVVAEHGGELPATVEGLLKVKGIGPYTAGAIASISHGVVAPIVDGNVLRVASRLRMVSASAKESAFCADGKLAWALARKLVEAGGGTRPGEFNQALMELGATLCAPSGSGIDERDPLAPHYESVAVGRDAYAAHAAGDLSALIEKAAKAGNGTEGGKRASGFARCPVCAKGHGAMLEGLRQIDTGVAGTADEAGSLLFGMLPLAAEKKARREERHAVAALFRTAAGADAGADAGASSGASSGAPGSWLLVRRPEGGLLAGQWEFPYVVVAEDRAALPDDPGTDVRSKAIDKALTAAAKGSVGGQPLRGEREALAEPLEHIFSHVRHTMHVEYAEAAAEEDDEEEAATLNGFAGDEGAADGEEEGAGFSAPGTASWRSGGRTYGWLTEAQMKEVGVTAGVLKVLAAVKAAVAKTGGDAKARAGVGTAAKGAKKRKAAAIDEKTQPKLSSFFTKK